MSALNLVRQTATNSANQMRNTETQPNYYQTMMNAEYGNKMAAEKSFQGLHKTVMSDPTVTGQSSIRHTGIDNYFGYLHIYHKDSSVKYNVGLPTGGGKDVFPVLRMPRKYSLSGR